MKNQFQASSPGALCKILKTMGNENRFGILCRLIEGEAAVGDIEKSLGIKQPNLSHELKKLRDLGLVTTRRESKVIFYAIASEQISSFVSGILQMASSKDIGTNETLPAESLAPLETNQARLAVTRAVPVTERTGEYGMFPIVRH